MPGQHFAVQATSGHRSENPSSKLNRMSLREVRNTTCGFVNFEREQ